MKHTTSKYSTSGELRLYFHSILLFRLIGSWVVEKSKLMNEMIGKNCCNFYYLLIECPLKMMNTIISICKFLLLICLQIYLLYSTASFWPDNNTNKTKSFIKIDCQKLCIFHTPEQQALPVRETPIFLSIHLFSLLYCTPRQNKN